MSLTSIQEEIVCLSAAERARFIDFVWQSADGRVRKIEAKWAAESEERIDAVDRGELETVDGPSALRDLRSSLRKWTASALLPLHCWWRTRTPQPCWTLMKDSIGV